MREFEVLVNVIVMAHGPDGARAVLVNNLDDFPGEIHILDEPTEVTRPTRTRGDQDG